AGRSPAPCSRARVDDCASRRECAEASRRAGTYNRHRSPLPGECTMRRSLLAVFTTLFLAACAANAKEVKVLLITGDEVGGHKWKETAPLIKKALTGAGHKVDITETPSKDLTPENLAKYDVFVLNYRNTPQGAKNNPASVWSDENKNAFLDAVKGGKG